MEHPDVPVPTTTYGKAFQPGDLAPIPEADLPPGLPAWMRSEIGWATRVGPTAAEKRATIAVTVPADARP